MPLRSSSSASSWSPLVFFSAVCGTLDQKEDGASLSQPKSLLSSSPATTSTCCNNNNDDDEINNKQDSNYVASLSQPKSLLSSSPATTSTCCNNNNDDDEINNKQDSNYVAASLHSNLSIQTLPSLPSLQISSLIPSSNYSSYSQPTPPSSARHRLLSSLTPPRSTSSAAGVSTSLAVSPPNLPLLLYSASQSGIAVYDLASLRLVDTFHPAGCGGGSVKSLVFSPDGRVFTAHQDSKIRVWRSPPDTATETVSSSSSSDPPPSPTSGRRSHHRLIASLPTVADRLRRFAIPSNYVAIRRHRKRLWIEHADAVAALAVRDGLLYSVSWDKTLKIWRASDLRCLESVPAHEDAVNAVAVSADGTVYTGSADRRIRVWGIQRTEPESGRQRRYSLVATLEKHRSAVNALALSDDGSVLYSGACDRSILVWEREESADHMVVVGAIRGHRKAIMCLACVEGLLFSGSTDRTVRMWRRTEGGEYRCLGVLEGHANGVRSLVAYRVVNGHEESESGESAGSEEEYRVCSGSSDGDVRIWQVWFHPQNSNKKNNASSDSS